MSCHCHFFMVIFIFSLVKLKTYGIYLSYWSFLLNSFSALLVFFWLTGRALAYCFWRVADKERGFFAARTYVWPIQRNIFNNLTFSYIFMTILDLTKNLDWFWNFEDEPLMSYQNRHFLLGHQRLSSFKLKNHKKFLVIPRIDRIYSKYLNISRYPAL